MACRRRLRRLLTMLLHTAGFYLRVAFERGLQIIDLRLICTEPADYANPIEPSGHGGRKISEAIARTLGVLDGKMGQSRVYAG